MIVIATARGQLTPAALLTLPRHARAAGQARHTVAALAHYDEGVADRGQLLVTEAVTNAVEHAEGPAVKVQVHVDHETGGMLCAVFDSDARPLPEIDVRAAWEAESGRGLALIKDLSDEWGHFRVRDGKWVWFHLRPAPAAA